MGRAWQISCWELMGTLLLPNTNTDLLQLTLSMTASCSRLRTTASVLQAADCRLPRLAGFSFPEVIKRVSVEGEF